MKIVFTLASLVTLGSLAVLGGNHNIADASPLTHVDKRQNTISDAWCNSFKVNCIQASAEVCGGNNVSHDVCNVSFNGDVCTQYSVSCTCIPTGGSQMDAVKTALLNTFAATNGACSTLPVSAVPLTSSPPSPSASSSAPAPAVPSPAVPSPAGTSAPAPAVTTPAGKNSASKSKMSQSAVALTAAIVLGLLCL